MKATFVSLFIFLTFSNSAWGQSHEILNYWRDTGYGLNELMQEPDFTPKVCMSEARFYSSCLMTLSAILEEIKEEYLTLKFNGADEIVIVSQTEGELPKTSEEYETFLNQQRADFIMAYQMGLENNYQSLLEKVQKLALEKIPDTHLPFVAGVAYNQFLHESYDPHSTLIPLEAQIPKATEFVGIGAKIKKIVDEESPWKGALAIEPMPGSPALEGGLKKGDLILKVDNLSVLEETPAQTIDRLKGVENSNVVIEYQSFCSGRVETTEVIRGPVVEFSDWIEDSRFVSLENSDEKSLICADVLPEPEDGELQALYVPLTAFIESEGQDLCSEFVELQLRDLKNINSIGMIIDLRNNPGGLLSAVSCMLDTLIIDDGLIVGQVPVENGEIIADADFEESYSFSKMATVRLGNDDGVIYNKNIVVLVNGGSASASELFAGTIQDMERGFVVGEQTYGKGSVQSYGLHSFQTDQPITDKQPLLLGKTTAIYTLNSGRSPQNFGITPDFAYTDLGRVPEKRGGTEGEAGRFRTIQFDNNQWEQTRPDLIRVIEGCASHPSSLTQTFLSNQSVDESYNLPFVANYQIAMAKDILKCAPIRAPYEVVEAAE